jgi:transcriptional antiterminator RfaH
MSTELQSDPYWAVARSEPHREAFAAKWIEAAGFETFLPRIAAGRDAVLPMFINYLFVAIDGHPWQRVDRTPGVAGLIKFGDQPARCPDAEIAALKARCGPDGIVRLPAPPSKSKHAYAQGQAVRIVDGPFAGVAAIHTGMSASEREVVLLTMLGAARKVAIPRDFVTPR